jgi:hypothetical protein
MKKIIVIAILYLFVTSCANESNDYNNDHSALYNASAESLLTNAEKQLADQMTTPSVNLNIFRLFSQYWAETQYTDESKYRVKTRNIPDNHWSALYKDVLSNLETAKSVINAQVIPSGISQATWNTTQNNKLAIIEILEVYTYQVLVDSFGDIPYTNALNPNNPLPSYDSAATIYPKLIIRLNNALTNLDISGSSFSSGEYIYNGSAASWKLFGNSLKVKLGINLADVNNTLAKTTIESAYADGLITSNAQNATFIYKASAPNYNPIYANLVQNQRDDFVPTSIFIDQMNSLNDPRRVSYFTLKSGVYSGGVYGSANAYSDFSHVSDNIKLPDAPGILFESTEVNFYLAEAAARGYSVGNSAEYYYNNAISESFTFWGLSASDASSYLANPNVAYTTAPGASWKEKIGNQAWIAYYNRGFESWTTWRRLDAPNLQAPSTAYPEADGVVPKRYTYPINEQTVNGANYQAAAAAIGGDKLATKVFWDVN